MASVASYHALTPSSRSSSVTTSRRRSSLLDLGGDNSLNQLVRSISRTIPQLDGPGLIDEDAENLICDDQFSSHSVHEPLLTTQAPKSTVFQTVFNSINTLIGIGVLSLPLLFKLNGLLLSAVCLALCGIVTQYTASLLAKCYIRNSRFRNYNELGSFLIGDRYNVVILILFNMDLVGAIVLSILLFADSFHTILQWPKVYLKVGITLLLFGLNFLSLSMLSVLSLSGILCTTSIIVVTLICGLVKHEAPGSLWEPVLTKEALFPSNLTNFFVSVSIMMSNFGGHAVLPEFINDLKDPNDSFKSFKVAFSFTLMVDMITGTGLFLMFGALVSDEFTQNLISTPGYPKWCTTLITLSMGLLPISKLPLVSRPIMVYLESKFRLQDSNTEKTRQAKLWGKVSIKLAMSATFAVLSLLITEFGRMMALLGSFICFTVCVTLPLLFYLKVFMEDLGRGEKGVILAGVGVSVVFTIAGTVASAMN